MRASKHHGLLIEILNKRTFGKELRHITHLMSGFLRQHLTCARKNCSSNEYWHVRQVLNKFLHESQILSTIILCRHMDLQKRNIHITQIIIIPFWRVADK